MDASPAGQGPGGPGGRSGAERPQKGAQFQGKSIVPTPGDTVIQRAVIFTDAVGPNLSRTTARFLYVEAFNKSTKVTGTTTVTGPTLALSYAGSDGVYSTATNMGRFVDTDPTPDYYMYHRQLIRLPDTFTADPSTVTIRIATAATTGGAAASTETFPVTEWLGKDLPAHVAGFKKDFITHYQDPLETRNNLDALAAQYPDLVSIVLPPEKSGGYQRNSQAIMSGSNGIGSTPDVQLGAPIFYQLGRDHRRGPGRHDRRSRRRWAATSA